MLLFDRYVGGCFVYVVKLFVGGFRAAALLLLLPVLVRAQALSVDPLPASEAPAERAAVTGVWYCHLQYSSRQTQAGGGQKYHTLPKLN